MKRSCYIWTLKPHSTTAPTLSNKDNTPSPMSISGDQILAAFYADDPDFMRKGHEIAKKLKNSGNYSDRALFNTLGLEQLKPLLRQSASLDDSMRSMLNSVQSYHDAVKHVMGSVNSHFDQVSFHDIKKPSRVEGIVSAICNSSNGTNSWELMTHAVEDYAYWRVGSAFAPAHSQLKSVDWAVAQAMQRWESGGWMNFEAMSNSIISMEKWKLYEFDSALICRVNDQNSLFKWMVDELRTIIAITGSNISLYLNKPKPTEAELNEALNLIEDGPSISRSVRLASGLECLVNQMIHSVSDDALNPFRELENKLKMQPSPAGTSGFATIEFFNELPRLQSFDIRLDRLIIPHQMTESAPDDDYLGRTIPLAVHRPWRPLENIVAAFMHARSKFKYREDSGTQTRKEFLDILTALEDYPGFIQAPTFKLIDILTCAIRNQWKESNITNIIRERQVPRGIFQSKWCSDGEIRALTRREYLALESSSDETFESFGSEYVCGDDSSDDDAHDLQDTTGIEYP